MAFNSLYNETLPASGNINDAQRALMFSISKGAGYSQAAYINTLISSADLLTNIRANTTLKKYFLTLYAFNVTATPVSANLRSALFRITGDTKYNAAAYLVALPKAGALYEQLQTGKKAKLRQFNKKYGTSIKNSGAPTSHDLAVLFGIVADPGYNASDFWKKI